MSKRYIFGPIASRRLGISLGVDLVSPKICSLDCIYCEARKTTKLTLERKEYVPICDVIEELDQLLNSSPTLDFITFSGAGEPTLNIGIGKVVDFLKSKYPQYKICLLTNGCSLNDPNVLKDIEKIDRIVPSLDASNEEEFIKINRPAEGLDFDKYISSMIKFTHNSKAEIFLELFIAPELNDSEESQDRFVNIIEKMRVDLVQLNTLDRPGTEKDLQAASRQKIEEFIHKISKVANVEAVGKFRYKVAKLNNNVVKEDEIGGKILAVINRRPATLKDLSVALDMPESRLHRVVDDLFERGKVALERGERGDFYHIIGEYK